MREYKVLHPRILMTAVYYFSPRLRPGSGSSVIVPRTESFSQVVEYQIEQFSPKLRILDSQSCCLESPYRRHESYLTGLRLLRHPELLKLGN